MELKKTKIWKTLKKVKNERAKKKHYRSALKMPESNYEEYLIERYADFANRREYSKGQTLCFDNPNTFSQKMQWIKLYDQDDRKRLYTDKYLVRKYIAEVLGEHFLIPLITLNGRETFDNFNDIDFSLLPNSFVIKCTHGSHMNIIVRDKRKLNSRDYRDIKNKLDKWLKIDYAFFVGLELQYHNLQPKIIIEQFLDEGAASLTDYKFFCFSGKPTFVTIIKNRGTNKYTETTYDINFKKTQFSFGYYNEENFIERPSQLDEMISLSKLLAQDFSVVRVDFFDVKGHIYFGELTFSPGSGYEFPKPIEYDAALSELIKIDNSKRDDNYRYRKK